MKVTHAKFVFLDSASKQHWPICEHIRRFAVSIKTLRTVPAPSEPVLLQAQPSSAAAAAPKPWIGRELFGETMPPASYNIIKRLLKKPLPCLYAFKQMPPNLPLEMKFGVSLVTREAFLSLSKFTSFERILPIRRPVGSNHPWNAANVIILKWIYFIHVANHENCCFESAYMYTGIVLPTWEQYKPTQVVDHHYNYNH